MMQGTACGRPFDSILSNPIHSNKRKQFHSHAKKEKERHKLSGERTCNTMNHRKSVVGKRKRQ
jgi:hypothetical protein